jgi:hypothetical protein
VLIALEQDNEVQAGVVHLPVLGNNLLGVARRRRFSQRHADASFKVTDPGAAVLSVNSLNRISETPFSRGLIEWASRFWRIAAWAAPRRDDARRGQIDVWIEPRVAEWTWPRRR